MNKLLFIVLLLSCDRLYAQSDSGCSCDILLKPVQQTVPLYDKPYGRFLFSIMNDSVTEDYYNLDITGGRKGWFKVIPVSMYDTLKREGWIKKEYTGIYPRNYDTHLNLYAKPDANSIVLAKVEEYFTDMLQVEKCSGQWLYVSFKLEDKVYEGWLHPYDQCANQYTTCN